ncbi:MAG: BPL-N domain-containing protein [Chlamydiae bacterium]|nr:BPL-N domain-containing protein [Chlamydiota bacterium]
MSGNILIYNKSGVDPDCLSAVYKQIKYLVDDRFYRIEYFSQTNSDDSRFNPVSLLIIPGGSYTDMADELKPLAARIRHLVTEDGASYLGLCAGAIAATRRMLMYDEDLAFNVSNPLKREMFELPTLEGRMHLNLYSGICSSFQVPLRTFYGTQEVKTASPETEQKKPYHLYFQSSVFFPNAEEEPDADSLLKYTSYRFSGFYRPIEGPKEVYKDIEPIAALTQKVGKGRLLLSGVHPEIGADTVQQFSAITSIQKEAKNKTIDSLNMSKTAQIDTMRDYLHTLFIATKREDS